MKPAVIVGGTLGLGTALVFGAAALASAMFPNGGTINASWNGRGIGIEKGFAPAPMPIAVPGPVTVIDDGKTVVPPDEPATP